MGLLGGQDAVAEGDGEKGAHGGDLLGSGIGAIAGRRASGAKDVEQRGINETQHPGGGMVGIGRWRQQVSASILKKREEEANAGALGTLGVD